MTDDTACSFVQRYEPGQGGLKPHFDHRWMFQEAILSLSLEGEGELRMHRGGRVKSVTLARLAGGGGSESAIYNSFQTARAPTPRSQQ